MNRKSNRGLFSLMVIWLAAISCTLPSTAAQGTPAATLSDQDLTVTAMSDALTAQAGVAPTATVQAEEPPTASPLDTPCTAIVTANTNVNIRSGPGTAYDIIGVLPTGGTAPVAGKNDSGTWWYIQFPGGPGGYAWIAGSVTTATCVPPALQIVAAPPLPTAAPPTATDEPPPGPPAPAAKPDLFVSEYSWSPVPPHMGVPFNVRIGVYNQGNATAGAFTVQWWLSTSAPAPACTWNVASLVPNGGRILQCDYTPGGWANYPSQVVVDSGGSVDESNEGNNTTSQQLQIQP